MWKPKEIIVHEKVKEDPVTQYIRSQCPDVPVKETKSGRAEIIVSISDILSNAGPSMLDKIVAGKQVVYLAPAGDAVDVFSLKDDRMKCPHFPRLKLSSNGCFYQCDWCYMKLTFRAKFPYIIIRTQ